VLHSQAWNTFETVLLNYTPHVPDKQVSTNSISNLHAVYLPSRSNKQVLEGTFSLTIIAGATIGTASKVSKASILSSESDL